MRDRRRFPAPPRPPLRGGGAARRCARRAVRAAAVRPPCDPREPLARHQRDGDLGHLGSRRPGEPAPGTALHRPRRPRRVAGGGHRAACPGRPRGARPAGRPAARTRALGGRADRGCSAGQGPAAGRQQGRRADQPPDTPGTEPSPSSCSRTSHPPFATPPCASFSREEPTLQDLRALEDLVEHLAKIPPEAWEGGPAAESGSARRRRAAGRRSRDAMARAARAIGRRI